MARIPASLTGGKGPRQQVWDLIRAKAGARFEIVDVVPKGVNEITAHKYVKSLLAAGHVKQAEERPGVRANRPHKGYQLVKDVGAEAPRLKIDGTPVKHGLAQEQMWRTLRMLGGDINASELAAHASTPSIQVPVNTARSYLAHLCDANFVQLTAKRSGSKEQRYRLTVNTGPRAPLVCGTKVLYDPNTDKTHSLPMHRVTEEDAIYGQ